MTDDERQARIVEAALAGELRLCGGYKCCKKPYLRWDAADFADVNHCPWCAGQMFRNPENILKSKNQQEAQSWLR